MNQATALWGGRFRSAPDPTLTRYSRSDANHLRLVKFDVTGSHAHANELVRAGILTPDECQKVIATLNAIAREVVDGTIVPIAADEDIDTPDILKAAGVEYCCDWVLDDLPTWMKTKHGPLICMPYTLEINDSVMHAIQHYSSVEMETRVTDTLATFEKERDMVPVS